MHSSCIRLNCPSAVTVHGTSNTSSARLWPTSISKTTSWYSCGPHIETQPPALSEPESSPPPLPLSSNGGSVLTLVIESPEDDEDADDSPPLEDSVSFVSDTLLVSRSPTFLTSQPRASASVVSVIRRIMTSSARIDVGPSFFLLARIGTQRPRHARPRKGRGELGRHAARVVETIQSTQRPHVRGEALLRELALRMRARMLAHGCKRGLGLAPRERLLCALQQRQLGGESVGGELR